MGKLSVGSVCLFISIFLIMNSLVFAQDLKKMGAPMRRKCLAETGTTADIVDDTEIGIFPDDEKVGCYFKCIFEKFNMFQKNDKINLTLLKKIIPDHFKKIGNDMIDGCTEQHGKDRCELSYNFMKCLYYENPVAYLVI